MNRNPDGTFLKGTHWRKSKPYWLKDWLYIEYVIKKKSALQIADENGCKENNIYYFLNKYNLPVRSMAEIRANKYWGVNGKMNGMFGKVKESNPNWKGGISFEMKELYISSTWHQVCEAVWKRDNNICQRCFKKYNEGMPFHVHHITHRMVTDRLDVSKSVLLCKECHIWKQKDKRSLDGKKHLSKGKSMVNRYAINGVCYNPKRKNPGDVWDIPYSVQPRKKDVVEYRNLPDIDEFSIWLNKWRKSKGITIDQIENEMGRQSAHHWFNSESFPSVNDWIAFKEKYAPPLKYDNQLLEVFNKPAEKQNNPKGKNPGDVWSIPTSPYPESHFAVFPLEMVRRPILAGCPVGGTVLDPFAGSGTVGEFCRTHDRNAILFELNPEYGKLIKDRAMLHTQDINTY